MSFRTTVILALLLAVAAGFWYVYDYRGEKPREEKARLAKRMYQFQKDRVRRVTVTVGDTVTICERRPDSTWAITTPVKTDAERWSVEQVLGGMEEMDQADVISERSSPELLADYGLRRPSVRVYLDGAGIDTLCVGDDTPTGGFAYAKRSGRPEILTIGSWQANRIRKSLFDLRDKTAIPFERQEVGRIEIRGRGEEVTLARNGPAWRLERPIADRSDEEAVSKLLTSISGSRIQAFVEENPANLAAYGLSPAKVTLTLYEGKGMIPKTVEMGDMVGSRNYARYTAKAPVFAVDTAFVNTVAAGVFAYRNKAFAEFPRERVTRVEWIRPDSTVACEMDTGRTWNVVRPAGKALDREGDSLLASLNGLKARGFAAESGGEGAKFGMNRPGLTVRLSGKEGPILTVRFGRGSGDRFYALSDRSPTVYEVDGKVVQDLWPALRDRK